MNGNEMRTESTNMCDRVINSFRVYPREPPKKKKGKDKSYYHVKDIRYIEADPIIDTLRLQKVCISHCAVDLVLPTDFY